MQFYRETTELDPDDPQTWNGLGILLHRIGNLTDAEKSYGRMLQLTNTITDKGVLAAAYGSLSNIYKTRGDLAKACEAWVTSRRVFTELGNRTLADQVGGLMRDAGCPTP